MKNITKWTLVILLSTIVVVLIAIIIFVAATSHLEFKITNITCNQTICCYTLGNNTSSFCPDQPKQMFQARYHVGECLDSQTDIINWKSRTCS